MKHKPFLFVFLPKYDSSTSITITKGVSLSTVWPAVLVAIFFNLSLTHSQYQNQK